MSIETSSSPKINTLRIGLLSEKKNPTQEELASLKEEIHQETNAKKKFELQKKLVRLERFDNLKEVKSITDTRQKEAIEKTIAIKDFDSVRNSDLLTLKKRGIDIANLVLVDTKNPEKEIQSSAIKETDVFTVNFWANKSLDRRTGAGDILPANIRTIKINGIECERRNSPRPGYYSDNKKASYQDIHDGDTIEIIVLWSSSNEDIIATENQWKKERLNDMIDYNDKNPFTDLEEDVGLFSEINQEIQRRQELKTISSFWLETIGMFDTDARNMAKKIEEVFGIPWEVTYGQAALETWFGKHAPNNNYFGIKGAGGTFHTKEFINGEWIIANDSFRGYASMEESFIGYAQFLHENPRYKNAFLHKDDPKSFLEEIKHAGYATDPAYVSKIENIWEKAKIEIT